MCSARFQFGGGGDDAAMQTHQYRFPGFFTPISIPILPAEREVEVSRQAGASPFVRFDSLRVFGDGFLVVGIQVEEFDSHADAGRRMHDCALNLQPAATR
jgi:hypothetical protein